VGNIAITVIDLGSRRTNGAPGENAFHEKAGRSQVGSFVFSLDNVFSPRRVTTVATLPSALFKERFCSLGASWVFSFQPVLPPDYRPRLHLSDGSWARRLTQSPELGFWAFAFPFEEGFCFCLYAAAGNAFWWRNGS
jgi:hypothetical protein